MLSRDPVREFDFDFPWGFLSKNLIVSGPERRYKLHWATLQSTSRFTTTPTFLSELLVFTHKMIEAKVANFNLYCLQRFTNTDERIVYVHQSKNEWTLIPLGAKILLSIETASFALLISFICILYTVET